MSAQSARSFSRRHALAAFALLPAEYALAQTPTVQPVEPPAPASIAPVIAESEKLRGAKKFSEAITVLEARQKALGDKITADEKRALLVGIARAHYDWANEAMTQYRREEAIQHSQSAYNIDKTYRPKDAAMHLNNIGVVYQSLGESAKSLDYYRQSLSLHRQVGNKKSEANTLGNLGVAHDSLGEKGKALDYFNQALPLKRQVGDQRGEAATLNSIGRVYESLGESAKALDYYNQSLFLRGQVGDKAGEAMTLGSIGVVYLSRGEQAKALDNFNLSLSLARQSGNRQGEATMLGNIGSVYSALGEKVKALDYFNLALPLQRQVGNKQGEAVALGSIGSVYSAMGEKTKALDFYNQALPLQRQIGDQQSEAITADNIMYLFADTKNAFYNPFLAITFGKQSVNLYQTLRADIQILDKGLQATFAKKVEYPYRRLADLLITQGRLPEAQQILDQLKAREFADFARPDTVLPQGNLSVSLTPREATAKERYDTAGAKITTLAQEVSTLSRAIRLEATDANKQHYAQVKASLDTAQADFARVLPATIAEFQAAKPNDKDDKLPTVPETQNLMATLATLDRQTKQKTVAIYTLVADEHLHCLVCTPQGLTVRSTPIADADLNKLVANFRTALENPDLDARPWGKKLYDLLVAPIAGDVKNAQSVLWSLDGSLRYVPLAALSPDGKTYLVEQNTRKHSLFAPGALPNLSADTKANWNAAAFGVTQKRMEDGLAFDALPGVGEEIQAVGLTVPTRAILDAAFTEDSLRAGLAARPPVVHIATHFAFRPNDPPRSFLLLGKGALTLDAMLKSKTSLFGGVDLLTLSACDTATGGSATGNGKEVDSLAFLAQQQGAGAVLASLWPVNDASTQALMQSFYARRKTTPGLGKAECLRQAQVAILTGIVKPAGVRGKPGAEIAEPTPGASFVAFVKNKDVPCAHPYYWAAFTLTGNTK